MAVKGIKLIRTESHVMELGPGVLLLIQATDEGVRTTVRGNMSKAQLIELRNHCRLALTDMIDKHGKEKTNA